VKYDIWCDGIISSQVYPSSCTKIYPTTQSPSSAYISCSNNLWPSHRCYNRTATLQWVMLEKAKNVLEHIRHGYYSDPPSIQLYYVQGQDKDGLFVYCCCKVRMMLKVEWIMIQYTNLHPIMSQQALQSIYWETTTSDTISMWVSFLINVGQKLIMYNIYNLIQCGTYNCTGHSYVGHYDISLKNKLADYLDKLQDFFTSQPPYFGPSGWVNGNNYQ
jgi:hypothetical protein